MKNTRETSGRPRAIGIVDDDQAVRMALASLLRSTGLESRLFESGAALLGSPWLEGISCLILDQRMKGMTGLDVMRVLRDTGHDIPVILISAHDDPDTRGRAAAAGVFAFISKPFHDVSLMEVVCGALECGVRGGPPRSR